jgi:hypothetical protein
MQLQAHYAGADMRTIKRLISNLGLDGVIFGVSSLAAVFFGFFSFLGYIPIEGNQLSAILIGAMGLLMAAVVALTTKRKNEIEEIKEAIGVSESEILRSTRHLEEGLASSSSKAGSLGIAVEGPRCSGCGQLVPVALCDAIVVR